MKKLNSVLLALFLCMFATACGQKDITIDIELLTRDLLENVDFEDELSSVDSDIINSVYGVDSDSVKASAYIGSGATAEEIVVFEAQNNKKAKEALELANKYIEERKEDFESYNPKEINKLNNATVLQKDNYIIICVTNDEINANKVINKHIK